MDIGYIVLLAINLMKAGTTWEWDSFEIISQPTWIKAWFVFILFFVFSFTSIKLPLRSSSDSATSTTTAHVVVKFGELNPNLAVALMLCTIVPQALFWYALLIALFVSFFSEWFLNVVNCFNKCLKSLLTTLPIFIVVIRATAAGLRSTEANTRWYRHRGRRSLDDGEGLESTSSEQDGLV